MLKMDEGGLRMHLPADFSDETTIFLDFSNFSDTLTKAGEKSAAAVDVNLLGDANYEQFLADIWVGIVLTLMVLSCVCFMCSCLIYHKFQQWKSRVLEARNAQNIESGPPETELPSYTIASGLPSYEEALEQLKKVKEAQEVPWVPQTPPTPNGPLSVKNLLQIYRGTSIEGGSESSKPS